MKKLAMLVLAFLLTFGLSSGAFAANDSAAAAKKGSDETVTYKNGITTIVKKKEHVSYDKIVKTEKSTEFHTEKKFDKSSYEKTFMEKAREKHPHHDWYRDVTIEKTFKFTTTASWDEVTRYNIVKKYITPVKITKTTVTTIKHKGKPGKGGKVISKTTKTYFDKDFGKRRVEVKKSKDVFKKNFKKSTEKKLIDVDKTYGEWEKGDKEEH
ncbi:hypothetical protein [Planococcus sp. YIM B11945]|uniref:hypothetical protein n=1 Tax=Planococcus sp. YIM B11945 TaxID=3435410 RepID=UPI003D7DA151